MIADASKIDAVSTGDSAGDPQSPSAPSEDSGVSRATWAAFFAVLLIAASAYTVDGLRLEFMTDQGLPGPGFFPRIVGIGLILSILYVLVANWKRLGPVPPGPYRSAVLVFGLAATLFIVGLTVFGTGVAIGLYLFGTLSVFNPRRHVVNLIVSVAISVMCVLLFDVWLGVPLPESIITR